jgi:regulatory protein
MTARDRQGSATTTSTDPAERARAIALNLLNHSPRSSGQLRSKLIAKEVPPEVADSLIERYQEVGLLDDEALARTIARTRHHERGQARRAITQELVRKEFPAHIIEAALSQISDDDERDAARGLAAKRWAQLEGVPEEARTRRVVGMLGRKGYGPSTAFAVVKDLSRADREGS